MQRNQLHALLRRTGRLLVSLLACGLLGLLATPLRAQDDDAGIKTVVVQGVGAGADKAKARDEALVDAQRRAVEQGVGLYLKSETVVANLQLISDDIYRNVKGYVHTYKIVAENYNAEKDLYWVQISAQVRAGQIGDDLDDLWERLKVAGNPRIIVAIEQPELDGGKDQVANTLTGQLVETGFKVLDDQQLTAARDKDALKMLRDGRNDAVIALSLQDRADVVIVGRAAYRDPQPVPGSPADRSCQATLDVRAIRTDTGQVIAATRGKGLGAGPASVNVAETALEGAAKDWLAKNIGLLVKTVVDPCTEFNLNVTGCTHADIVALDEELANSRFIRKTDLVAFDAGFAQMTVQYQGTVKMLSKEITALKSVPIAVESVTARGIRAHISHGK